MSFVPRNHPQQTGARGALDGVDDRVTPWSVFRPLHDEFAFTVDAAASDVNARLPRYFTLRTDGLTERWAGERVWCNPPYSNIPAWVAKAAKEAESGDCPLAVLLVPANRTEQRWWQMFVEPHRDRPGSGLRTRFLPHRINFASPEHPDGKHHSSAPFGCVLLIFGAAFA